MPLNAPAPISAQNAAIREFLVWREQHDRQGPLHTDLTDFIQEKTVRYYEERIGQLDTLLADEFTIADPSLTKEQLVYRLRNALAGYASEAVS